MFGFKKSTAGVVKEEFECECCGTLDGQAQTDCGCGSMPSNGQAQTDCGCGSMPSTGYAGNDCCSAPTENAKPSSASGNGCSCS